MGRHERAWSGLGILVYGQTPMVPMQIEQSIAGASPNNEVRVDSFEDYEDAYNFSKEKGDIGFIFLLEDCGKLPPADVFKQLSRPYENRGWKSFGVLVHNGVESIQGLKILRDHPQIVDYVSVEDLKDKVKTAALLDQIWEKFYKGFESSLLPQPLQETLWSVAQKELSEDSRHFIDRVSTILASKLNVSWMESVALRWQPVVATVEKLDKTVIEPHPTIQNICKLAEPLPLKSLKDVVASKEPLVKRINTAALIMDQLRKTGMLENELTVIATMNKPGAGAMIKHIALSRAKILDLSKQEQKDEKKVAVS